ncbi:LysR family transcriptional regulator [Paracoccus aminophilus]|uniref:Transcriptional regulator, LysR family n=1 Tax=Paracoccus aminophilus JCM 7686 TaxID=1367847 RepID=S5XU19_PARAH|nr:LysR family transcriptional regulator [Paracoccus aminophilus]AGT11004.1 transcriptional regulator, LysR family [Paracoccus aminophilus JCM 7686]
MDLDGFDLNLLVAFDALMTERHVTRAATRLGISQPAMSAALARLRRLTGDELFVRSAHGFAPTPRALDLARPLRHALDTVREALGSALDFDPGTTRQVFTLALSDHPAHVLLPGLSGAIAANAPFADIRVRAFGDRRDAISLLDEGAVDVAIGVSPGSEARILDLPLFEERFVGVARKGSTSAAAFEDLDAFSAATHVLVSPEGDDRGVVDEALARLGRSRRIGLTAALMYSAPSIIAATDYVGVLLEGVVRATGAANLSTHALPLDLAPVSFHLLWHRRTDAHPAQKWLRATIVQAAHQLELNGG